MSQKLPARIDAKQKNQTEIVRFLREYGAQSRADLTAHIRLTKAAVAALTNDMLQEGRLVEQDEPPDESLRHRRGRRRVLLDINENYRLAFGVAVEKNQLQIGVTNLKGKTLSRLDETVSAGGYRGLLERIVEMVNRLIRDNCIPPELILGGGICLCADEEPGMAEGANVGERLARIKMDLSHALDFPLTTATTCVGALAAQKLFADRETKDMLLLRFGEKCGCAVLTNGRVYRGFTRRAGGFARAVSRALPGGIAELRGQPGLADGSHPRLNELLREAVLGCVTVLDPERVAVFGDYMETEFAISSLNRFLEDDGISPARLEPAVVTEHTVFLAGCATAIGRYFDSWEI